jgi:methionyl-tRNA formyltransferase
MPEKTPTVSTNLPKVIFFGNGPLADFAKTVLAEKTNIIFHARTREDLAEVARLKRENPDAYGILASFGVMIKPDLLELFEPEGILNLHPSLLPRYRGASPIESAILAGDKDFSFSIMKLVRAMDAGPVYHQATLENLPLDKTAIYQALAETGTTWLVDNLSNIRTSQPDGAPVLGLEPTPQDDTKATFCGKLDKSMSFLQPNKYTAPELLRQIVAYQGFPKPKYEFFGKTCIILKARVLRVTDILCEAAGLDGKASSPLMIKCADRNFIVVEQLQPEGKKPMDAISFMNGYGGKNSGKNNAKKH